MRINFDFVDLEAFLAVKDTGSFHLASVRLGLSQSSVTRRIQKLETALDSVLFERTTRDVKPTLAAKRLQVRAENILAETREAALAMRDESIASAHQRAGSITLATIPTVIAPLVAPVIRSFWKMYPKTRIRVLDVAANDVAEAVSTGDADLGICPVPVLEPATTFELLFNDPIVIAMQPGHPLALKRRLSWSDLLDQRLILPARGTGNRMMIDDALAATGLPLTWALEVGRSATGLDMAVAGLGIVPLPRSALLATKNLALTARPVRAPQIARPIGILRKIGHGAGPATEAFAKDLQAAVADGHLQHESL